MIEKAPFNSIDEDLLSFLIQISFDEKFNYKIIDKIEDEYLY